MSGHGQSEIEIERIRAAYRERDAVPAGSSPWLDRAHRRRLQDLEWELLEALARAGIDPRGLRVLEVGCGSGYFLSRFLDYGAGEAAGIDLMDDRVAIARERDPRLELVAGDAAALPWPDASFDLVTQFTCLSSVVDRELRQRIAAEMWRVLRPGGAVVSYDMHATPRAVRLARRAAARRRRGVAAGTQTEPVEAGELRHLFPAAALDIRRVTLSPDLAAPAERARGLAPLLGAVPFLRTHLLAVGRKPA
jgi:SAM-dependent methyltransferase